MKQNFNTNSTMISSTSTFSALALLLLSTTILSSASLLQSLDPVTERLLDPFRVLEHIPFELERGDLATPFYPTTATVNWKETAEAHEISIDVPGMKKDELKIEVLDENRVLRVSGERKREEEKRGEKWHRVERAERFWRQFRVPENVELDAVKAKLEDGVLTVTLPKLALDKVKGPRTVNILGGDLEKESLGGVRDVGKKVEL
ncbi:22.0 kDa class IV heat shock protein [Phalaenopsis equestris]|uniref:22.0 kDa class IV heat shock protein n=1 Tax=Phalaenopsis equestris TaxID=78828 RepID=UPI0009E4E230|nr:22.0 kDa class IV heat shock protein [Phalaenopsis equestris]